MSILTARDLHWFHMANAGQYYDKKTSFYPFKTRFLHRFGTKDGHDSQELPLYCYSCNGTGKWHGDPNERMECRRCDGSGIYTTSFVWLARYQLGNRVYHIPDERPEFVVTPKETFTALITHEPVDGRAARRCFQRLLLRHEPTTFYWYAIEKMRSFVNGCRMNLVWRLV